MILNCNYNIDFRRLSSGSSRTAGRCRPGKTFLLVAAFAVSLMVIGGGGAADVQHAGDLGQVVASDPTPYHLTGGAWSILDLSAPQSGYAFAQTPPPDSTPPTFVSSKLNDVTRVLTITFSEVIDVTPPTNVVPTKIHIRDSGNYTDSVTLTAGELGTAADAVTISFILTRQHLLTVTGQATPELMIEPGAVRDTSGNLIASTFDVSTAAFVHSFNVSSQDTSPRGMAFSNNGAKMFVVGDQKNNINEYTLSTPFDVSTASPAHSFNVSSQDREPISMAFSNNGAKMFVVGLAEIDIYEYTLRTPFKVSTASFVHSFDVFYQDFSPRGMAFSNDGAKMFVAGDQYNNIYEYTLSTPFDVSTASFDNVVFSVSDQDKKPEGMAFSNDGAKMFVVGWNNNAINEYTLPTPFDISTASFVHSFNVSSQDTSPRGMALSNDGTKMFVVGDQKNNINEYTLSSVYPIRVTSLPAGAFVTIWKTTSANEAITFPGRGTYTIDWGDGSSPSQNVENQQQHTYALAGNYTVSVSGNLTQIFNNCQSNAEKLISIEQWGDTIWGSSMNNAFCGASQMTYDATDNPNLSSVSDMGGMFRDTSFNGDLYSWNVSSVTDMSYMFDSASHFNGDLSSWDVSLVTDMSRMFSEASSFNGDLSSWDVSSVTSMSNMFFSAFDFNGDLSSWDVSSVTSMSNMFFFASSFNGDLSRWDVSSVDNMSNMSNMFTGAYLFQQNLGNWYVVPADTTYVTSEGTLNVTTISAQNTRLDSHSPSYGIGIDSNNLNLFNITDPKTLMFKSTPSTGIYTVNVTASGTNVLENGNNWRLLEIRVTDQTTDTTPSLTAVAFATTWRTTSADKSITLPIVGSGMTVNWGDGNTTAASGSVSHTYNTAGDYTIQITGGLTEFRLNGAADASKLVSLDQWGTASWTSMNSAFSGAGNMVYNAADSPDLSSVTDISFMFRDASAFNQTLNSWDVSSVRNMSYMFQSARSFNGDLSSWNVSSVTDMYGMFNNADSFDQPIGSWDVSKVTDMGVMFQGVTAFDQTLNDWDVSKVTLMNGMFQDATAFDQSLNSWDVSKVTDMNNMFNTATAFDQSLNSWDVSKVTDMSSMFFGISSSFDQNLGNWYVVPADTTYVTSEGTLNVTTISAQNTRLDGHSPSYGIGSNSNLFNITGSNTLMFKSTPPADTYNVTVTASGTDVFSNGNNWRLLEIRVTGQTTDTTPPELSLRGSSSVTIEVDDLYSDDGATCRDTVDGTITPTKTFDNVDTSQVGSYTVTYSCADTATNTVTVSRTVIVKDTTPPELTLTGSSSVAIEVGDSYSDDGATCRDTVDGTITPTKTFDNVDTSQVGSYTVTYSCADAATNTVTVSRTVIVETSVAPDNTPLELTLTGSSSVTIEVDDLYSDDGATCRDTVDVTITPTKTFDNVDTSQVGSYTVTYSCADAATNAVTVSRTVIVEDNTPPELTLTGSASVTIDSRWNCTQDLADYIPKLGKLGGTK